jgi:KipI family sensor histidine kinase inhibitor
MTDRVMTDRVMTMRRRPCGPDAWMLDDLDDPAAVARGIIANAHPGIVEVIPAATTVLVRCLRDAHESVGELLDVVQPLETSDDPSDVLTLDVTYDGADLADVAEAAGLTVAGVIARHLAAEYRVAFCGFSPGFGYLRGLDPSLHLPRRATPRTTVRAGSVAIAASFTAVYPTASPGGWHLIGSTTAVLWDTHADPPAAMWPGRRVRFRQAP